MAQKLDMPKEVEDQLNYWEDRDKKLRVSRDSAITIFMFLLGVLFSVAQCFRQFDLD